MNFIYLIILEALIAFCVAFFFLRKYIPLATNRGFVGKDVHKINKPEVAEMGGFGILFGFLIGIGFAFPFFPQYNYFFLATISTICLTAIVGIFDDLFALKPIHKLLLLFVCAVPLVITRIGDTSLTIPFLGKISLGLFYTIIFVPLFINVFANMTNFFAGYNGLEAGLGIITITYVIIAAILLNKTLSLIILIPFLFALIAFYLFNKYPAKVFPGDVGTLIIGTILAIVAIIDNWEIGIILFTLLYLINFAMYCIYVFIYRPITKYEEAHISGVDSKGYLDRLYFDKKKTKVQWHTLYYWFEHVFYPCTEKKLVAIFFTIQFVLNAVVLLLWFGF